MNLTRTQTIFKIAVLIILLVIPILWILSQEPVAASIIEIQQNGREKFGAILQM